MLLIEITAFNTEAVGESYLATGHLVFLRCSQSMMPPHFSLLLAYRLLEQQVKMTSKKVSLIKVADNWIVGMNLLVTAHVEE